ncbi:HDOD domain-containing protein [Hahella sp. CR1]|uniref:EAL and HDOD domain-containing protein n=1 Tax=Hahella sp. CR1 TaxID=2992807 RepID=UPI0024435B2A|nr:HDOD domain-containing protein [Hahella sp. CR1]MDG9669178.1 HDOD domain-containing protein [Hahella sp. CR1]
MEQILLARQPIVDASLEIVGYELLFRSNDPAAGPILDGDKATSVVLLNAFTEKSIQEVTSGHLAFVNFTEQLLMEPPPFPKDLLVIEILESVEPTKEICEAVARLAKRGYTIALDDYDLHSKQEVLLEYASIVKLEFPAIEKGAFKGFVDKIRKRKKVRLLAEKIETHDDFEFCLNNGCELFQGYFFSKPEIVTGRKMPQSKLAVLRLIAMVQNPDASFDQIVKTIASDPPLSVKLLQLINSISFRRPQPIDSIHKAAVLLGLEQLRAWVMLLALSGIEDKPKALIVIALIRARMCEQIAATIEPDKRDTYFTIGLFSTLDAFFDRTIEEILSKLPLSTMVIDALLRGEGKAGLALITVRLYERCDMQNIPWAQLEELGLNGPAISKLYRDSIVWADERSSLKT